MPSRTSGVRYVTMDQFTDGPDLNPAQVSPQGVAVVRDRCVPGVRVFGVVPGDCAEGNCGVFHSAADGADLVHRPGAGGHAVAADPSPAGPQADDAAPRRRTTDRAAGVLAQRCGAKKGGRCRAGSAAGAAGESVEIPRVAVEAVSLGRAEGELGQVGLAQQDSSGPLQICDSRGVLVGKEVGHEPRADGGPDSPSPDLVLDRHRDSVHRAEILAPGDGPLRLLGSGHRLVAGDGQVRVELEVEGIDAIQVGRGCLNGRDLSRPDQFRKFRRGQEGNILLVHGSLLWRLVTLYFGELHT